MNLISPLLSVSHVAIDVDVRDKKDLFRQIGALLETGTGLTAQQIADSLTSRERLGSTALGKSIAIPHGRVKGLREATGAFLRLRTPLPFEALDGVPVNLVFVLLVPERATDLHLEILSSLANMFSDRDLRAQLASAPDALAIQRAISNWQPSSPPP